jgi:SMI1 / KNR4 family (SUKH-1)
MDDIKTTVADLLRKVPMEPGYVIPTGVREEEIGAFETRTGLKIPTDLAEWLRVSNGPIVGPGGIFGVRPERADMDIEAMYRRYPQWKVQGWIPIAGDGSGNYYATTGGKNAATPVFFIDTHDDPDEAAFIVASNVWIFLHFLFRRELGEKGWPFAADKVLAEDPAIEQYPNLTLPWDA